MIIVDDKSSEKELQTLKEIESKYNKFEFYYSKVCKGGGAARNIALDKVLGRKVIFADSDDLFCDNMELILDRYKDDPSDIIYFNTKTVYCETQTEDN